MSSSSGYGVLRAVCLANGVKPSPKVTGRYKFIIIIIIIASLLVILTNYWEKKKKKSPHMAYIISPNDFNA